MPDLCLQWEPIWNGHCHLQVYCQSHLQVYCQSRLQVYCQNHIQVYPSHWNCHWQQMKYWLIYCLIYVFSENPLKLGGIRSLLKFTPQVYSSSLLLRCICKFYPPFETVIDGRSSAAEKGTFKFTARITFKFCARPESPSSLLPESPLSLPFPLLKCLW